MGADRKSNAVKELTGNPGRRELGGALDIPTAYPPAPEYLEDAERELYDKKANILSKYGLLTVIDADALAEWCFAEIQVQRLMPKIREHGGKQQVQKMDSIGNEFFESKTHPDQRNIEKWMAKCKEMRRLFGGTPRDRVNFVVKEINKDDLEELIK